MDSLIQSSGRDVSDKLCFYLPSIVMKLKNEFCLNQLMKCNRLITINLICVELSMSVNVGEKLDFLFRIYQNVC